MTTARRILIASGTLVMGYAVVGALTDPDVTPFGVLIFLIGVLAAHDAVLLPLAIGVGALAARFLPARGRTPVRVALVLSLAVTVVALPFVLGYGRSPDNPSVLPLPYGRGLLGVLAAVWVCAALYALIRTRRDHHPRTAPSPD